MERSITTTCLFLCFSIAVLVSEKLVIPVMCRSFEDQKNYYPSPDPSVGTTYPSPDPSVGTTPPTGGSDSHHHHHHGSTSPPSHGSGGSRNCGSSPSHGSGGSSSHGNPPSGGSYSPTPPSGGGSYNTPTTPSTPDIITTPPSTPTPTPIIDPGTPFPGISTPPSPLFPPFDPNSPPPFTGTCNYWSSHPDAIWALLGWWGTVGSIFSLPSSSSISSIPGTTLTLPQALSNTRTDGIGALYREGTASLLNSMVNSRFPFTTQQVRDHFASGLVSNTAAAAQAQLFKQANEGRL